MDMIKNKFRIAAISVWEFWECDQGGEPKGFQMNF